MSERSATLQDLPVEAQSCRLNGHDFALEEDLPYEQGVPVGRGLVEAVKVAECRRKCGYVKTWTFVIDKARGLVSKIGVKTKYEKPEFLMRKGYGRVNRDELRYQVTYMQLEMLPVLAPPKSSAKKRVRSGVKK